MASSALLTAHLCVSLALYSTAGCTAQCDASGEKRSRSVDSELIQILQQGPWDGSIVSVHEGIVPSPEDASQQVNLHLHFKADDPDGCLPPFQQTTSDCRFLYDTLILEGKTVASYDAHHLNDTLPNGACLWNPSTNIIVWNTGSAGPSGASLPDGWLWVCDAYAYTPVAFGDPHMRNLRGDKFQIRKTGVHTMLAVPQSSNKSNALLHVDALVNGQQADDCDVLFVKTLTISGLWLGSVPTLFFSAEDADGTRVPDMRLGNSTSLSVEEVLSRVPTALLKIRVHDVKMPTKVHEHASTMVATLRLQSGVSLKISRVVEVVRKSHSENSLWLSATGLHTVSMPIGGLMGIDDYASASKAESKCKEVVTVTTK